MPYQSDAQRRFMHAKHPAIAKRWDKEYPNQGNLPERKKRKSGLHAKVKAGLKKAFPKD